MQVSKHPIIGLNQDDDEGNLQPGWCREIWNMLPKNGYSKTSAQNTLGTLVRSNGSLASNSTCIGSFADTANNRIFYFIRNSNIYNHSVWYFNPDTNTHTKVLQTLFLNFSLDHPILSCDFIEDIMIWTDGYNETRSLIVSRAVANLYTFTTQESFERQLSVHKYRPELPPISSRVSNVLQTANNISEDSYQFCFQVVYFDNAVSKISPLSLINVADTFPNASNPNNQISVSVPINLCISGMIKKIYFLYVKNGDGNYWLFREGSAISTDPDFIAGSILTSTHAIYTILFLGNETVQFIPINNVNQIPVKTNNVMIHNQRSYMTMNSFDYPASTATLSATKATPTTSILTTKRLFLPLSSSTIGLIYYDRFGRTPGVDVEATASFAPMTKTYPNVTLTGSEQLALNWTISGSPPSWAKTYAICLKKSNSFETVFSCLALPLFYNKEFTGSRGGSEVLDSGKLFRQDSPTVWDSKVYWKLPLNIPFVIDGKYKLKLLNSLTGATYFIEDIINVSGDVIITTAGFGVSNWRTALNNSSYGLVWISLELYKDNTDEVFFEVGKQFDCSNGSFSTTSGQIVGEYHYIQSKLIYKPLEGGNLSYLNASLNNIFYDSGTQVGKPIITNVISQSPTHSSVSLDLAVTKQIGANKTATTLNDSVVAAGSIFPGWVGLAKATHTDLVGNIADKINKDNPAGTLITSNINQVYTVDYNKSCADFGRAVINVKNKKVSSEPDTLSISDPYIINSKINGLFDYQILFQLPISRTSISKLLNISGSNIFLAVHRRNTTSLATYSGDNILHTTSGTQLLGDGKSIIGYENELAGSYGTIYPDSAITAKGRAYFFDAYSGEVIRYANGLVPLARIYKMKTFFRQKGNQFIDTTGRNVIAGYDGNLDILYMTFLSTNPDEQITIAFIERQGEERWYCFTDFIPEKYVQINDRLFGFIDGVLWEFNQNSTRNLFFGTQYTSRIKHLFNPAYSHEKMLNNVSVESTSKWDFGSITTKKNGVDQETSLAKTNFIKRDDLYYADLKRDKNTAVGLLPAGKSALVAGQPLIGKVYEVNLENDDTDLVELDYLNYGFTLQSGHNIV